jgi:hypothetical protein
MAACFAGRVRDGHVIDAHDYLDRPPPGIGQALVPDLTTSSTHRHLREEQHMPANTADPNETTAVRRKRGEDIMETLRGGGAPSLDALDRDFPFLAQRCQRLRGG